ncbi:MAG: Rpn family recombination-promoting nuclease/putative transposase [Proteobacteria bacterium]|nr:Rpn family recombination-promoting nuclease/putative transposase [Pseudomonadota bacterium]
MPSIDCLTKELMSNPVVFADAFNLLLYDGEQVIKPETLKMPADALKNETKTFHAAHVSMQSDDPSLHFNDKTQETKNALSVERMRDILKRCVWMHDDETHYFILGIENQTDVHYLMPVRTMLYDALTYTRQMNDIQNALRDAGSSVKTRLQGVPKGTKLFGVVTLVCYFGKTPWDGPLSLHDLIQFSDERMKAYIPNYFINLFDPHCMSPEKIDKLQSDLGAIYACYKAYDDKVLDTFFETDCRLRAVAPVTSVLLNKVFHLDTRILNTTTEETDMCQIIQERYKQEYDKGFKDAQDAANEKFVLITQAMNAAKDEARTAKDEARTAKDEARTAKDEARNLQHNAVLSLMKYGNLTLNEIAQTLAIPLEAVEEIVNSQTSQVGTNT